MFFWEPKRKNISESVGGMLFAAALGATVAIISDSRRRDEIRSSIKKWLEESGEKFEDVKESAGRIKKAVEKEVDKNSEGGK